MQFEEFAAMDRRQWLARALAVAGIAATAGCDMASLGSSKGGLSEKRRTTLAAISDTIVPRTDTPGAVDVRVPALIDAMLTGWASAETREAVTGAIDRIDAAASAAKGKAFAALSPAERKAVLTAHEAGALKPVPPPPGAPTMAYFIKIPYVADGGYLKLKDLVIALYYSSEAAMTKELIYEAVPGQWQPSFKTDATTRPWGSAGLF